MHPDCLHGWPRLSLSIDVCTMLYSTAGRNCRPGIRHINNVLAELSPAVSYAYPAANEAWLRGEGAFGKRIFLVVYMVSPMTSPSAEQ